MTSVMSLSCFNFSIMRSSEGKLSFRNSDESGCLGLDNTCSSISCVFNVDLRSLRDEFWTAWISVSTYDEIWGSGMKLVSISSMLLVSPTKETEGSKFLIRE